MDSPDTLRRDVRGYGLPHPPVELTLAHCELMCPFPPALHFLNRILHHLGISACVASCCFSPLWVAKLFLFWVIFLVLSLTLQSRGMYTLQEAQGTPQLLACFIFLLLLSPPASFTPYGAENPAYPRFFAEWG